MLRATIQAGGHQSPHQRKHDTARLPMVAGLVSLILTNLLACSGGGSSSSSHDPALASTCSSPTVSGSPLTNTLNSAQANHTATLLSNGTVLVTGGSGNATPLTSAELYNPTTGQWAATDNLTVARASHTATLLPNGSVLVTGGSGSTGLLTSAELYNPTTGQWTATGNLTVARTGHTATLLPDGTVLAAGGRGKHRGTHVRRNHDTFKWDPGQANLELSHRSFSEGIQSVLWSGAELLSGGNRCGSEHQLFVFDPQEWDDLLFLGDCL